MNEDLAAKLMRAWQHRGLLAWSLWPLSLLFRGLTAVRRGLYRLGWLSSARLPVPVIVVGNIFIGGTGKTPLVIWLVQQLQQAGLTPGVISRGYGVKNAAPLAVTKDSQTAEVGDEPVLIACRAACPVMVGRKRAQAGQALLAAYPDVNVIVTDDGLQHYALQRDVEIILFDGRGIGNGWTLPAGPLREPASRRRDITVVNAGTDYWPQGLGQEAWQMTLQPAPAWRLCDPAQTRLLASWQDCKEDTAANPLAAVAGIGNPARFFAMLRQAGLKPQEWPLPDHDDFSKNPFAAIAAEHILITEKDAVKCGQIESIQADPRIWVVPVTAQIDQALAQIILEKVRGYPTA